MKRDRFSSLAAAVLVSATLLVSSGCQQDAPAVDTAADAAAAPAAQASDATGAAAQNAPKGFEINSVPVSSAALGAFPYFTLPAGYAPINKPDTRDFDRFPFWVGDRFEWVEGRSFESRIGADRKLGKRYSEHELRRNLEHVILAAGGVKVAEGKIPREATNALDDDVTVGHNAGLGDIYNEPTTTYVIRRADQNIWVHLVSNSAMASWMIMATEPFVATATLLPADELRQQLDSAGKVAVQVNFATDEADILPDSLPQIEQVLQLLQADPALRLAINGHTDNSGDATRNQALSELRAQAVVAALVAQGIAAGRLQAQGFGASEPVADNGDAAGRARNRRVELVRI